MRSTIRAMVILLSGLLCLACAGGSALTDGDEDRPPDGDWIWNDGDDADGDPPDGDVDGDPDETQGPCDPAQDAGYCEGRWRFFCDRATRRWQGEDCTPDHCEVFGAVAACVSGEDGDEDGDPDADGGDPDPEPDEIEDGDLDLDPDVDEDEDEEIERELVIHLCQASAQFLGPACLGHQECADFCEAKVGAGCWVCGLDASCAPVAEGEGSCQVADPDPEEEEEIPWECSELDPWTCTGNFLNYCLGGFWAQINCATSGQTCEPTSGGAQCGGTAVDGDDDGDGNPCTVDPSLSGPGLAVDDSELDFSGVAWDTVTTRQLIICNIGAQTLRVSALHLEGFAASPFFVPAPDAELPLVLESGEQVGVSVAVLPTEPGPHQAALLVAADDPQQPLIRVPLAATTRHLGRLQTVPGQTLRFPTGAPNSKTLQVSNTGDLPLTLSLPNFVNDEGHYYPSGADISGTLAVGQSKTYTISHSGNPRTATLEIPWTCTGCGSRLASIGLTTVTGDDCPLAATLPDREVYPLTRLVFDARASVNPDGALPQYRWSWVQRPALATTDFLNDSQSPVTGQWGSTATPTAILEQAGTYLPQLTVRDNGGQDCGGLDTATATLSVVPLSALYVTLTVAPGGGNHDLYLVRPGASLSIGNPDNTGVCYVGNCLTQRHQAADCPARGCPGPSNAPDWGVGGVRGDDPMLLLATSGAGLEALMLDVLETGQYQVVVANVAGGTTTDFTVQVWVYGVLRLERSSRITQGNCHHERVATLTVAQDKSVSITVSGTVQGSGCR